MKAVVALLVIAGVGCVVSAVSCERLLNCKTCLDEKHCKDCPSGYVLDAHQVCRYDCSKFGNCQTCTDKKCTDCGTGMVWNATDGTCYDPFKCTSADGAACKYCGKGHDLIDVNGKCSTCAAAFGEGCTECSESRCTSTDEQHELKGAVSVLKECGDACPSTCQALFPGCTQCDGELSVCQACSEDADLVDGFCKIKTPVCEGSQKLYFVNGKFQCGNCSTVFGEKCRSCDTHSCTQCQVRFGPNAQGTCINCSEVYPSCAVCNADGCSRCFSSRWILTPNGCFDQSPYVPPEESNAGMIVGIVIAVLVLVVLIVLVVYCVITTTSKKGAVDPSLFEDDFEFKSMSML